MNGATKIALYTILIVMACVSGFFASRNFKAIMDRSEERAEIDTEENKSATEEAPAQADPGTNETAVATGDTNTSTIATNVPPTAGTETNNIAVSETTDTNTPPANATVTETKKEIPTALGSANPEGKETAKKGRGGMGLWTGIFLLSVVSLGILLALDVAHMFGNRALKTLYNDEGEGIGDPDYELAEKEWSNGNHLEAINMMREYLKKHPREQHVALRIAEIYEKDLNNPLAAALEYEEVLTKKLAPERWGWAAIHLCNLYFKLNQEQKAFALLRRLVAEHPDVPAAEKARKRLEQVDGTSSPDGSATSSDTVAAKPAIRVVAQAPQQQQPQSNLPPGFRPKK